MAKLLDPKKNGRYPFQYRKAAETDVRKTFERARREQQKKAEEAAAAGPRVLELVKQQRRAR